MRFTPVVITSAWLCFLAVGTGNARLFDSVTEIPSERLDEYGVRITQTGNTEQIVFEMSIARDSVLYGKASVFVFQSEEHKDPLVSVPIHSTVEGTHMVLRFQILKRALAGVAIRFMEPSRSPDGIPRLDDIPISPGRVFYQIQLKQLGMTTEDKEGEPRPAPDR